MEKVKEGYLKRWSFFCTFVLNKKLLSEQYFIKELQFNYCCFSDKVKLRCLSLKTSLYLKTM